VHYLWWKHGVLYQIYPRSFQDSNGDGIGDLDGIIERLDYLNDGTERSLGIDGIWLSPTFPSPMKDFGYDVSDYEDVHPDFGTLKTMDRLIEEAHQRGIRIVLDFVPNHTSDQHAWFRESRSSPDSPKRDWYTWRDAKADGSPPNNWIGAFGGPAWEWDQKTQQYYLHSFLVEQPDLNWRNPEVERAMHNVLRFWMDRGVDGFRIDVMDRILKDPELRDNPPNPDRSWARRVGMTALQLHTQDIDWPDIIDAARRIRRVVDEYPERMTVGEVFGTPENIVRYYGGEPSDGLHLAFNFSLTRLHGSRWTAENVRKRVDAFESALPDAAWPNIVLGNHDIDRFISRVDHDGHGRARARAAAVLLLTLRGTPFIYYGEEIGMANTDVPEHRLMDPARRYGRGRDPERTPMQWSRNGGFSNSKPWLPYGDLSVNVQAQEKDHASMLSLYRKLIWTRRRSKALTMGDYAPVDGLPADVFAFTRTFGDERMLTLLNLASEETVVELPPSIAARETLVSTRAIVKPSQRINLAPHEGRLVQLA
jgi:alpha-glucosidase